MISDESADKARQWQVDNADNIARAAGRRSYLEHKRKLVLAEVMSQNADKPLGVQERIAHSSAEYRIWLEEYGAAVTEHEKWQVLCGAADNTIRIWQSRSANLRGVK